MADATGTVVRIERDGDVALLIADNPPVNALSTAVRRGLDDALATLGDEPDLAAVVILCAGRTFFAGADIREFGKPPEEPLLRELLDRIEAFARPIVAAVHGTALGGGCELALASHYRIAAPTARLGLPEIKLGLIPGAGGTQRLPRLIDPLAALDIIVTGDPVTAKRALELGLVDRITDGDLRADAVAFAREVATVPFADRRASTRQADAGVTDALEARAAELLRRREAEDAPRAAVDSVLDALRLPFAAGMSAERERFVRLRGGEQSAARRHLFFAERAAARVPGLPEDTAAMAIGSAAVIGAGTMGAGIAQCFAAAGIPVTMIEPQDDARARGLASIRDGLERGAKKSGRAADQAIALVTPASSLDGAAGADLVIEAVFEDMALKKEILSTLETVCGPDAVLATNTSTLDIDVMADGLQRPGQVVGMHFFSPAPVMRLVEVVRAARTAPAVLRTAIETSRKLGKLPVTVGVCYGFVGNRMLHARFAELERLLLEGETPAAIDGAMTGFGFAMGPCAVSDLAGLDVGWRARRQAGRTAQVADALCELGRFGQKTGKGYYLYASGSRQPVPDPEVDQLIRAKARELGVARRSHSHQEIQERLLFAAVNEGARILEEGIAARSSDVDLIWVNGYGYPAWRGGPMFHADSLGLAHVAARLDHYAEVTGVDRLRPAPLLRRLADEGSRFADAAVSPVA